MKQELTSFAIMALMVAAVALILAAKHTCQANGNQWESMQCVK